MPPLWKPLISLLLFASPAQFWNFGPSFFQPSNRLSGIGLDRRTITDLVLEERTKRMIETQTFSILRDPRALAGAQRVTALKLDRIYHAAEQKSGVPAGLISAISYLESWGEAKAESPTGPKGIMQIAAGTAHTMGLQIVYATKYRVTREKRTSRNKRGKLVTRTVRVRTPYTVLVRDERLIPERAIPAAAQYLARLGAKFGSMDWAVFAYHCGEGCVTNMRALTEHSEGIKSPPTVAKMFFGGNPAFNRELYEAVHREMERDYSPTYWFRVMRAQELLDLYRRDPADFQSLVETYRYDPDPAQRAPHRLAVWLKRDDLVFQNCEDLRREQGRKLQKVLDDPNRFNFSVRKDLIGANDLRNQEFYLQASPAALGTLVYISYETRKLFDEMKRHGQKWVPIDVTSLVRPLDSTQGFSAKARS